MQRTKEKKNRTNRQAVSQQNKLVNNRRSIFKNITRNNRKKGKSNAYVNFLTSNSLKKINCFDVISIISDNLINSSIIQIIKDIYPVIKDDISIFLHQKSFNENTSPAEFLHWMLSSYENVYSECQWDIYSKNNKHHIIKVYDYDHNEMGQAISLDFLPFLKKENIHLYKMITCLLSNLYHKLNVPFYFDNEEIDDAIEHIECEINDIGNELLNTALSNEHKNEVRREIILMEETIQEHKTGYAKEVENDIRKNFSNFSLIDLQIKIESYLPESSKEKDCIIFLKEALKLFKYKDNLSKYVHIHQSEWENSIPITPNDYACMGWNYDDDNPVSKYLNMIHESNWNESGSVPYRYSEIDNEDVKPSKLPIDYLKVLELLCNVEKHY
jgi:hypothetical protein